MPSKKDRFEPGDEVRIGQLDQGENFYLGGFDYAIIEKSTDWVLCQLVIGHGDIVDVTTDGIELVPAESQWFSAYEVVEVVDLSEDFDDEEEEYVA